MFVIHDQHYRFYKGETINGKPHGLGALLYAAGYRFDGHWVEGELQAEGLVTFKNMTTRKVRFEPKFHDYPRRGFYGTC